MITNPKVNFINSTRELINSTTESAQVVLDGITITTDPEVFNPSVFFSSQWFADRVSKLIKGEKVFIEIGCGTGIVSIKAAIENPSLSVHASDINSKASPLTKTNAEINHVANRIHTYTGDVFDAIPKTIKANSIFWAMPFGYLDPEDVLTGRDTQTFDPGYRAIEKFFSDAHNYLSSNGRLLIGFSVDIGHFELLENLIKKYNFTLKLLEQTKGMEKDSVSMEIYEARLV